MILGACLFFFSLLPLRVVILRKGKGQKGQGSVACLLGCTGG